MSEPDPPAPRQITPRPEPVPREIARDTRSETPAELLKTATTVKPAPYPRLPETIMVVGMILLVAWTIYTLYQPLIQRLALMVRGYWMGM